MLLASSFCINLFLFLAFDFIFFLFKLDFFIVYYVLFLYDLMVNWSSDLCWGLILSSVAPIIGSAIGYRPIIGIVMHIGISGAYPYRFFFFIVFSKHLVYSETPSQHHPW